MKLAMRGLGLGLTTLLMSVSSEALAQGQAPVVEEVVVTARRVEENVQTTPVSVQAFSAEALENRTVDYLNDITRIVPSVRYVGEGNVATGSIQMRGLGSPPAGTGGPAVQLYVQDVAITTFGSSVPAYDIGSLQVLRGPQGTLFGRNTLGGAILVYPQLPTFEQDGYIQGSVGNRGYHAAEGAVNLTLVPDVLAVRLAGQIRRRDGFIKTIEQPDVLGDLDDVHTDSLRASILFEPNDRFKNVLVLDYFRGKETGSPSIVIDPIATFARLGPAGTGYPNAAAVAAAVSALVGCDHRCVDYGTHRDIFYNRKFYGLYNTTNFELNDNLAFKNIFGYRRAKVQIEIDSDATRSASFNVLNFVPSIVTSEEFQILADSFDDRLKLILGAFYIDTDRTGPLGLVLTGIPLATNSGGTNTAKSTSKALYANANFNLTDKLRINGGFRYTWDRQTVCNGGARVGTRVPFTLDQCLTVAAAATPGTGVGILRHKAEEATWSVGIDYQATEDLFFYAVARKGYRSGGVNTPLYNSRCTTGGGPAVPSATPPPAPVSGIPAGSCVDFGSQTTGVPSGRSVDLRPFQTIEPETLIDQEIGMRSDWTFGGWSQRFNLTGYHYNYKNVAALLQVGVPATPPVPLLTPGDPGNPSLGAVAFNGGEVEVWGAESDLILMPTDSFTFTLGVAYTDQEQTKDPSPPPGFSAVFPPLNLPTPRWATTVAVRYVLPFRPLDGELVLNADYFYTARFKAQNQPIPGYELVNARLEWNDIGGRPISAALWVRNLMDEDYIVSPVNISAGSANFGEPRMYGLDLTYRFN